MRAPPPREKKKKKKKKRSLIFFCTPERHTALTDFVELYDAVVYCLQVICGNVAHPEEAAGKFDSKAVTEASGLLRSISSDEFIVSLQCSVFVSGYLKGLSVLLQGPHLDILEAYEDIDGTATLLEGIRSDAPNKFQQVYRSACAMTETHGRPEPVVPRLCARQTLRANPSVATAEDYWRVTIFIPFLDMLTSELRSRFSSLTQKAVQGLLLLPKHLNKLSTLKVSDIFDAYRKDLPDPSSFQAEIDRWKIKWSRTAKEELPGSLKPTLEDLNKKAYPNIFRIFRLLQVVPVTAANVERSNSALNYVHTKTAVQ